VPVHVFTFKAGLLSPIAHDLRLRCETFRIEVTDGRITASFDPRTLRVDGVMRSGTLDPGGLSASDYRKIEATVRDDVLRTRSSSSIEFTGRLRASGDAVEVQGDLLMAGRRAEIPRARARKQGDAWTLELELVPSRWGIAPYRALAGALKLQDRVLVKVSLPAAEGVTASSGTAVWT
jgi:hypothetical protein